MDEKPEEGVDSQIASTPKTTTSKLALQWASTVNAVQTQLFNFLFTEVAIKLTDKENHRLEESYEASLVAKIFIFLVSLLFSFLFSLFLYHYI